MSSCTLLPAFRRTWDTGLFVIKKVQQERVAIDDAGVAQVAGEEFFKTHFLGRQQRADNAHSAP